VKTGSLLLTEVLMLLESTWNLRKITHKLCFSISSHL
jgi:hypothetical protein